MHGLPLDDAAGLERFAEVLSPTSARQARRRLARLRAAAGILLPVTPEAPFHAISEDLERFRDALSGLSHVTAGPEAARARRDGVVLLLLVDHQLTRRAARSARARTYPLLGIGERDYPVERDARTCRACTLSRWLRTLAHARQALDEPAVARPPEHDCLYEIPEGWAAGPLLPSVDRWGQVQAHSRAPISARALTQIVAGRLAETDPPGQALPPAESPTHVPEPLPPTMTAAEAARRRRALREELARIAL